MPSVELAYVNVAVNILGLIITLIIFAACLSEYIVKKTGSKYFLLLMGYVMIALVADSVAWMCEGRLEYSTVTVISNTVASCAGQLSMICFMEFLYRNLYDRSKAAEVTLKIFRVFCGVSLAYAIGNAFVGYSFVVSPTGHYVHSGSVAMVICHLFFSVSSFVALILMALFATRSTKSSRVAFIVYTLFPMAGITVDYLFHGISLTYVSIVISVLVLYTNIYLERQRKIEEQGSALLLSQINPHFTYNTLSAIAAMCEIAPKQAKSLTIDFARYLRQNLDTMTGEPLIPFSRELEHVECYLKIEKARFGDNLRVMYAIQCTDFVIPPLTVQPLVENAVKHGITKKAGGGTVKISTYATDTTYVMEIIDDGAGFDPETAGNTPRRRVGLENVRSRVKRLCRGTVTVKSTVGVGTRVTVQIPRQKGRRA